MRWTRERAEQALAALPEPFRHADACRYASATYGSWAIGQSVISKLIQFGLVFEVRSQARNANGTTRVSITYTRRSPYTDHDVREAQALMGGLGMR